VCLYSYRGCFWLYSPKLNGVVTANVILKSLLQPIFTIALIALLGVPRAIGREAVLATALPSATIAPMLAARYGIYQAEAGSTMLLGSALMTVLIPVFMLLTR